LIMTTLGRSSLSRLLFGSVADKVIRSTAIPLLVIPPPAPSE
jgi:nucleotide-binding universal stress UspA family protein